MALLALGGCAFWSAFSSPGVRDEIRKIEDDLRDIQGKIERGEPYDPQDVQRLLDRLSAMKALSANAESGVEEPWATILTMAGSIAGYMLLGRPMRIWFGGKMGIDRVAQLQEQVKMAMDLVNQARKQPEEVKKSDG